MVLIILLGVACVSSYGQSPFVCQMNAGSVPLIRSEGTAELIGDIVLSCTGGVPTAAGQPVPQANFTVFFNTNVTTNVLAGQFSEALLVVDEPSSLTNPNRPVLNCGNTGAPDSGASGAGVCATVSDGLPADSYNGTPNGYGAALCDGAGGQQLYLRAAERISGAARLRRIGGAAQCCYVFGCPCGSAGRVHDTDLPIH
jgi:hypothetical protein